MVAACGSSSSSDKTTTSGVTATATSITSAPAASQGSTPMETGAPSSGEWDQVKSLDWDQMLEAAKKEGKVTYYSITTTPDEGKALKAAFEAQFPGIEFEHIRLPYLEQMAAADAEYKSGKGVGDVMETASPGWFADRVGKGVVGGLTLPNFQQEGYKPEWVHDGYFLSNMLAEVWAWNTDLVPNGIHSKEDFLQPDLAGQIGVVDPTASVFVDHYLHTEKVLGPDFIESVAKNGAKIYNGGAPIMQALAAGEIAATFYAGPSLGAPLIKAGAPIEMYQPPDPWTPIGYTGLLESAPHPHAAMILANWLLSPEAQRARGENVIRMLPGDLGPSQGYAGDFTITNLDNVTPEIVADYQKRFNSLFRP
jgi:iron(III) transport system substrate-binding protein